MSLKERAHLAYSVFAKSKRPFDKELYAKASEAAAAVKKHGIDNLTVQQASDLVAYEQQKADHISSALKKAKA